METQHVNLANKGQEYSSELQCKGQNGAVQFRWMEQYKKCVQYNFKCTQITLGAG